MLQDPTHRKGCANRAPLRTALAVLGALLALLAAAGCTQTTTFKAVDAEVLAGRPVMMVPGPYEPPLPQALHDETVDRVRRFFAESPYIGKLVTAEDVNVASLAPVQRREFELFWDTFTETGVIDPELAQRLGHTYGVDLLTSVQLLYLPCPVCEEGSRLWLVGQVAEAESGHLLLRTHLRVQVDGTPDELAEEADALIGSYTDSLLDAFKPKWHKLRFLNLKRRAAG